MMKKLFKLWRWWFPKKDFAYCAGCNAYRPKNQLFWDGADWFCRIENHANDDCRRKAQETHVW